MKYILWGLSIATFSIVATLLFVGTPIVNLGQLMPYTIWRGGTGTSTFGYGLVRASGTSPLAAIIYGASGTVMISQGAGVAPIWGTAGGSGTVTSVAMSVPTGLTIGGSPITSNGTLALTLTGGYEIPTTASTSAWNSKQNTISAGTNIVLTGVSVAVTSTPSFTTATFSGMPMASTTSPVMAGFQVASSTSALSSADKGVAATCPAGYTLIGGGGNIVTTTMLINLTYSAPSSTADTWYAYGNEDGTVAGTWGIKAWAFCAYIQ